MTTIVLIAIGLLVIVLILASRKKHFWRHMAESLKSSMLESSHEMTSEVSHMVAKIALYVTAFIFVINLISNLLFNNALFNFFGITSPTIGYMIPSVLFLLALTFYIFSSYLGVQHKKHEKMVEKRLKKETATEEEAAAFKNAVKKYRLSGSIAGSPLERAVEGKIIKLNHHYIPEGINWKTASINTLLQEIPEDEDIPAPVTGEFHEPTQSDYTSREESHIPWKQILWIGAVVVALVILVWVLVSRSKTDDTTNDQTQTEQSDKGNDQPSVRQTEQQKFAVVGATDSTYAFQGRKSITVHIYRACEFFPKGGHIKVTYPTGATLILIPGEMPTYPAFTPGDFTFEATDGTSPNAVQATWK